MMKGMQDILAMIKKLEEERKDRSCSYCRAIELQAQIKALKWVINYGEIE